MPLSFLATSDGYVRTYLVRAPPDWFVHALTVGPLPLLVLCSGGKGVQAFADDTAVEAFLRGLGPADSPVLPADGEVVERPKCVVLYIDQVNPTSDQDFGPGGGSFNSGSIGSISAALWEYDDVAAIDEIVGKVIAEFDATLTRLAPVTPLANRFALGVPFADEPILVGPQQRIAIDRNRVFGLGFSDGGYMVLRLLMESGPGGGLTNPLRGIWTVGAVVGGQYLHQRDFPAVQYVTDAVRWASLPILGTTGKALHLVHGAVDPNHELGDPLEMFDPDDLRLNVEQAESGLLAGMNYQALDVHEIFDPYRWTLVSRQDYSMFSSANGWGDGLGSSSLFLSLLSPASPIQFPSLVATQEWTRGTVADSTVRVWNVPEMDHGWPNGADTFPFNVDSPDLFEGIVVAWRFFEADAP